MIEILQCSHHLFDLDDTLISTRAAYYKAQEEVIQQVQPLLGEPVEKLLSRLRWFSGAFGSSYPHLYFDSFFQDMEGLSTFVRKKEYQKALQIYEEVYWENLQLFPHAVEYLEKLRSKGKTLSLVSNGIEKMQIKKLAHTQLNLIFPLERCYISGCYEEEQKKPSPYMLQEACSKSGISLQSSIYYGNMPSDILAGNLSQIRTVYYNQERKLSSNLPKLAQPDWLVGEWNELL